MRDKTIENINFVEMLKKKDRFHQCNLKKKENLLKKWVIFEKKKRKKKYSRAKQEFQTDSPRCSIGSLC